MRLLPLLCLLLTVPAHAATLHVEIEVPRLNVAEYHKPYIAAWIETPAGQAVGPLQLWYDDQTEWLHHLRLWWRRVGRALDLGVDGITGATRGPGRHVMHCGADHPTLARLAAGDYVLVVEAAREVGGREAVHIPFRWPAAGAAVHAASGSEELGRITLTFPEETKE